MKLPVLVNMVRFCSVTASVLLSAFAVMVHAAEAGQTIWQSREQFVSVVKQDSARDARPVANDHPAEIAHDRLVSMLSSIRVRLPESEKPGPLFTAAAIEVMTPHLRQGLQQAAPGEDVVFAVFGLHDALYGLAKSPRVTTGRVFVSGGKLNLIVGLVQKDVNEREDRRLAPFTPGSRQNMSVGEWTLLPGTPLVRRDWIVFGEEWQPPAVPSAAAEKKVEPQQVPMPQSPEVRVNSRTPAERMINLNELKEKGLITDQEYRSKRMEILNGI